MGKSNDGVPRDLEDRTSLVTGGARGIGAAIAVALARRGARVTVWDRDDASGYPAEVADAIEARRVDVRDGSQILEEGARALARTGTLDILVNNAGIQGRTAPIGQQDDETWERVISVNLTAVFKTCRYFAPVMQRAGGGRIVNIASYAGLHGTQNATAYSASKGGVISLSRALAKELMTSGVTVNCVAPGLIETDLLDQMDRDYIETIVAKMPMGRMGTADEVAATVGWIVSPACSFTSGGVFDVTGGRLIA